MSANEKPVTVISAASTEPLSFNPEHIRKCGAMWSGPEGLGIIYLHLDEKIIKIEVKAEDFGHRNAEYMTCVLHGEFAQIAINNQA